MAHEFIQPVQTLGAVAQENVDVQESDNPARKDYLDGRKFFANGEYAQAAIAFHNALMGFEEQGDQIGVANASDRLGDTCMGREEYAMAIANYQRASAICQKEDDSFSELALNKKLAVAHRKMGDQGKALELFCDMLEHYRLTNNPKGGVDILLLIAETYEEQKERAKAADAYRSAASIHTRFKHPRLAAELNERADALEQEL